eukprot:2000612-Pyramimonas_sp.AAC.2
MLNGPVYLTPNEARASRFGAQGTFMRPSLSSVRVRTVSERNICRRCHTPDPTPRKSPAQYTSKP